ncbi:HTH-type transcriptional regulator YidZ [Streptomyces aurantiogriseus]
MINIYEAEFRRADLNLLVVFSAVLRERSVSRAAQELRLSQAAVSAAVGRLRRLFGDVLFVRTGTGMEPTPRALEIARQVEPALHALHGAITGAAEFAPDRADRTFTVGLFDGRHCTTHHDVQDELARRHPRAVVVRDVLFTADDLVITSAGIASGIDLALHLLATRHGPAVAAQVAREMVVYARRNGHEPQSSAMLRHRSHLDDTVHRAQDLIDARFDQPLPLPALASAVGVSERTLTRLFSRATGLTPLRYQQTLRLERAQHLISHGATIDAAARSVGFEDPRMLRRLRARTA